MWGWAGSGSRLRRRKGWRGSAGGRSDRHPLELRTLSNTLLHRGVLGGARERLAVFAHGGGFAALLDRARFCRAGKRLAVLAHRLVLARPALRGGGAHTDRRNQSYRSGEAKKRGKGGESRHH